MDTGIKEQVLAEIIALAEKNSIEKLLLFGSRARGDYRRTSDIDLAVSGGNVAHAYNKAVALDIVKAAKLEFYDLFCELKAEIERGWL